MARLLHSLRRVLGLTPSPYPSQPSTAFARSIDLDFSRFREGDSVLIHPTKNAHTKPPKLTKPLQNGHRTDLPRGFLSHESIIGRQPRERIQAQKGPEYRVTHPTLEDYVAMTPRLVTPIYGGDAALIVSLLDIHVAPPAEGDDLPPLEILESGTGHGSLTLHLSRAIQAANPAPPSLPPNSQIKYLEDRPLRPEEQPTPSDQEGRYSGKTEEAPSPDPVQEQWDVWRSQRRAIIHTVDVSPNFSARAERTVRGFLRGLYAGNVDFYVGHVENWIAQQIKQRTPAPLLPLTTPTVEPFLTHAILDMPSAHERIPHVAPIVKPDGILAVFMPSITQIGDCVKLIRQQKLPFVMDQVVEVGAAVSGGRQWDVRYATKKSRADPSSWAKSDDVAEGASGEDADESVSVPVEEAPRDDGVLVCRPKVGTRIVGGGFVGIWRRINESN